MKLDVKLIYKKHAMKPKFGTEFGSNAKNRTKFVRPFFRGNTTIPDRQTSLSQINSIWFRNGHSFPHWIYIPK